MSRGDKSGFRRFWLASFVSLLLCKFMLYPALLLGWDYAHQPLYWMNLVVVFGIAVTLLGISCVKLYAFRKEGGELTSQDLVPFLLSLALVFLSLVFLFITGPQLK